MAEAQQGAMRTVMTLAPNSSGCMNFIVKNEYDWAFRWVLYYTVRPCSMICQNEEMLTTHKIRELNVAEHSILGVLESVSKKFHIGTTGQLQIERYSSRVSCVIAGQNFTCFAGIEASQTR